MLNKHIYLYIPIYALYITKHQEMYILITMSIIFIYLFYIFDKILKKKKFLDIFSFGF